MNKLKRMEKIVLLLITLMIPVLFTGYVMALENPPSTKIDNLSREHAEAIAEAIKFDLSHEETLYVVFLPGVFSGLVVLDVYIDNIKSIDDFFSRFHGSFETVHPRRVPHSFVDAISVYEVELFEFENAIHAEATYSYLGFFNEQEKLTAKFHIVTRGLPEELNYSHSFLLKYLNPCLRPEFLVPLIIQAVLVLILIVRLFIRVSEYVRNK